VEGVQEVSDLERDSSLARGAQKKATTKEGKQQRKMGTDANAGAFSLVHPRVKGVQEVADLEAVQPGHACRKAMTKGTEEENSWIPWLVLFTAPIRGLN